MTTCMLMASVGTADLAAIAVIPDAVKTHLQTVLNNGLSGGLSTTSFSGGSGPISQAITQVFDDALTQGAKWASFTAAVFVSFGALASLFLPNVKQQWGGQSGEESSSWSGTEGSASSGSSGENKDASSWSGASGSQQWGEQSGSAPSSWTEKKNSQKNESK